MKIRIGVKYCGGCNSSIDRAALLADLKKRLPEKFEPTTDLDSGNCAAGLFISGCRVGCADREELRSLAPLWISVAGEAVDLDAVPEAELAKVIAAKIRSACNCPEAEPAKVIAAKIRSACNFPE